MKTVLITGASRGIGNAIALEFLNKGYSVIGTATTEAGVAELNKIGIRGHVLDLNNVDSIDLFWQKLEKNGEIVSLLINNAGITKEKAEAKKDDPWVEDEEGNFVRKSTTTKKKKGK